MKTLIGYVIAIIIVLIVVVQVAVKVSNNLDLQYEHDMQVIHDTQNR